MNRKILLIITLLILINNIDFVNANITSGEIKISQTLPKLCQPDSQRESNNIIYTCSKDGMFEYTTDCTTGLIDYNNDKYICKEIVYNKETLIKYYLILVLGVIFILVTAFIYSTRRK